MAVVALKDFIGVPKDTEDRFHGNRIVYFGWDRHLMFYAPVCLSLSPALPFRDVVGTVLPGCWGAHPDFARIDWDRVEWLRDGEPFAPDLDRSLGENGIGHKSVVRLITPGLDGLAGAGI